MLRALLYIFKFSQHNVYFTCLRNVLTPTLRFNLKTLGVFEPLTPLYWGLLPLLGISSDKNLPRHVIGTQVHDHHHPLLSPNVNRPFSYGFRRHRRHRHQPSGL